MATIVARLWRSALATAAVATIYTPAPAAAEDWRIVNYGGTPRGSFMTFLNMDQVRRNGDTVNFWTRTIKRLPSNGVDETYQLFSGTCSDFHYIALGYRSFLAGELVDEGPETPVRRMAAPGSNAHAQLGYACGNRPGDQEGDYANALFGLTIPDPYEFAKRHLEELARQETP